MTTSGTGAGASGPSYAIYVRGEGTRAAPSSSCASSAAAHTWARLFRAEVACAATYDASRASSFASCGLIHKLAPTGQIASGSVKLQTVFGDIQASTHGVQRRHPRRWLHPWGGGLLSLGRGLQRVRVDTKRKRVTEVQRRLKREMGFVQRTCRMESPRTACPSTLEDSRQEGRDDVLV